MGIIECTKDRIRVFPAWKKCFHLGNLTWLGGIEGKFELRSITKNQGIFKCNQINEQFSLNL